MAFAALVLLGYLLGSCPWGYWLVRLVKHEDIRTVGSGNIGATNVWRTYGRYLGAPVVLLDVYEHAYFLDYQTDRASYIDAFFNNLDWGVVNDWVAGYGVPNR